MNWQPLPRVTTAAYDSADRTEILYLDLLFWRVLDDEKLEYMSIHGIVVPGHKIIRFT